MKQTILKLIDREIGGASDNIYRAKAGFRGRSPTEMQQNYGQSGESCQSILDGYLSQEEKYQKLRAWAEKNIPEN